MTRTNHQDSMQTFGEKITMRHGIIVAVCLALTCSCLAQMDVYGTWCYAETNRYGGTSRYSNETYVTTTHYQFTTNGKVRVIAYTPQRKKNQLRGFLNTKHAGTYTIDKKQLTITAKEVSGYVVHLPDLNDTYRFGGDDHVLVLTNATNGKVRSLMRNDNWTEPPRGDGVKPPPWP